MDWERQTGQEIRQPGQDPLEIDALVPDGQAQLRPRHRPGPAVDRLRPARQPGLAAVARSRPDRRARSSDELCGLRHQPGHSDAGIAADQDQVAATTVGDPVPGGHDGVDLVGPADERPRPDGGQHVRQLGPVRSRFPGDGEGVDGLGYPLEGQDPLRDEPVAATRPDESADQAAGENLPSVRRRAQPRRDDHRGAEIAPGLVGQRLPRVQSDPDRERGVARLPGTERRRLLLHRHCCVHGVGRALEGAEQAITGEVDLPAAMRLRRLTQQVEECATDLLRGFIPEPRQLLRGSHLIHEEERRRRHRTPPVDCRNYGAGRPRPGSRGPRGVTGPAALPAAAPVSPSAHPNCHPRDIAGTPVR